MLELAHIVYDMLWISVIILCTAHTHAIIMIIIITEGFACITISKIYLSAVK